MTGITPNIAVCICTYKRPRLLARTLENLQRQEKDGRFSYSIVVADNDASQSARSAVSEFAAKASIPIKYCVEPQQNIALARNRALENAEGEYVAFIDDDEFPTKRWLVRLFDACTNYEVDGALGPVVPEFESRPPQWVVKGGFFERPNYETGYKLGWKQTRTGNVLFRRTILEGSEIWFSPEFDTGGEDVDFFRRMTEQGRSFVWCREAVVYEVVPSSRCKRGYLLKRALLRGSNFPKHPKDQWLNIAKSLIALPLYTLILPVLALFGQHVFVKYLIKCCDHASRLLAFLGVNLVAQREM
ncbi:MAG: glycosyltransferase family 2 protein [Acidobacteriia bacterium]|nr:glycosyltransferase family 2 protein [Terriglobia bacterium]